MLSQWLRTGIYGIEFPLKEWKASLTIWKVSSRRSITDTPKLQSLLIRFFFLHICFVFWVDSPFLVPFSLRIKCIPQVDPANSPSEIPIPNDRGLSKKQQRPVSPHVTKKPQQVIGGMSPSGCSDIRGLSWWRPTPSPLGRRPWASRLRKKILQQDTKPPSLPTECLFYSFCIR